MLALRNHTSDITHSHTLESVTLKHSTEPSPRQQHSALFSSWLCVPLWFSQLGLPPNFTLAHYKLTTIPPPHLASGVERERDADNGNTDENSQWSFFLKLRRRAGDGDGGGGGVSGRSKQLRETSVNAEKEKVG